MQRTATAFLVATGALALASANARGDGYYDDYDTYQGPPEDPYSWAWYDPTMLTGIGVDVSIGGGVAGFTDHAMRETLSSTVAGTWEARVTMGTHIPLGLELGYMGMAAPITALGADNGTLIGETAEAALRWNLLPHYYFTPYVFGGAGWQRVAVHNTIFTTADTGIQRSAEYAEFPMGLGLSWRSVLGITADVRGTFRATTQADFLRELDGKYAEMFTWEITGTIGYEL